MRPASRTCTHPGSVRSPHAPKVFIGGAREYRHTIHMSNSRETSLAARACGESGVTQARKGNDRTMRGAGDERTRLGELGHRKVWTIATARSCGGVLEGAHGFAPAACLVNNVRGLGGRVHEQRVEVGEHWVLQSLVVAGRAHSLSQGQPWGVVCRHVRRWLASARRATVCRVPSAAPHQNPGASGNVRRAMARWHVFKLVGRARPRAFDRGRCGGASLRRRASESGRRDGVGDGGRGPRQGHAWTRRRVLVQRGRPEALECQCALRGGSGVNPGGSGDSVVHGCKGACLGVWVCGQRGKRVAAAVDMMGFIDRARFTRFKMVKRPERPRHSKRRGHQFFP